MTVEFIQGLLITVDVYLTLLSREAVLAGALFRNSFIDIDLTLSTGAFQRTKLSPTRDTVYEI